MACGAIFRGEGGVVVLAEREVFLDKGFLVFNSSSYSSDASPSETVKLPQRVADACNLFAEMGILREGRAYLVMRDKLNKFAQRGKYVVALSDDCVLFSMVAYADQAILLETTDGKSFHVDKFSEMLLARAKKAFVDGGLTKSKLGSFNIFRLIFDENSMSDGEALELMELDAPLENVVNLWKTGASIDVIKDASAIPASWLDRLLGDKE